MRNVGQLVEERTGMISWYWLIVAFVVGAFFGMMFIAMCVAAGRTDRLQEKERHNSIESDCSLEN